MSDLITRDRALRNLNGQTVTTPELAILDGLVSAASQAIESHCRRSFGLVNRDERHDGHDDPVLLAHHYPIVALQRVAAAPTPVLSLRNLDDDVQRASVRVVADGVVLSTTSSGETATETIPYASAPTVSDLADAVADLPGWSAEILVSDRALDPSIDFAACPGTWAARAADALLRLYVEEVFDYELDARLGVMRRVRGWPGGASHYRLVYTAGFDAVPADVAEACAQLVAQMFFQTRRDPGVTQEAIVSVMSRSPKSAWPDSVRDLLAPYRRIPRI